MHNFLEFPMSQVEKSGYKMATADKKSFNLGRFFHLGATAFYVKCVLQGKLFYLLPLGPSKHLLLIFPMVVVYCILIFFSADPG